MSELSKQNSYFDYKTNYSLLTSHSTILCGHVEVASKKIPVIHLMDRDAIEAIVIPYRLYSYGFRVKKLK